MEKYSDLHNHSNFSEDSTASMEDMCLSAIDKNISIIAFTEHADMNPADSGYLFFDEKRYSIEIKKLQKQYSGKLKILKGVEFGEPHLFPAAFKEIKKCDYDIILGSIHMIDDLFVGDNKILKKYTLKKLFRKYYELMLEMVDFGGFDVLAHFDFPKRYYHMSHSDDDLIDEILRTIIKKKIALEINTSPLRKGLGECSPDFEILAKYSSLGGKMITIGSDAHRPEDIGADFIYAHRLIQSVGGLKTGYFEKREFRENLGR